MDRANIKVGAQHDVEVTRIAVAKSRCGPRRRGLHEWLRGVALRSALTVLASSLAVVVAAFAGLQLLWLGNVNSLSVFAQVSHDSAPLADEQVLQLVGQRGGYVSSVGARADVVYVGIGPRLVVLDASDEGGPPQLVAISNILIDTVRDLVPVADHQVAVAAGDAGLCVFDVASPGNPLLTGCIGVGGAALSVTAHGDIVFVAAGTKLQSVRLGGAGETVRLGSFDLGSSATDLMGLAVTEDRIYAALGRKGLAIVDVADPSRPQILQWMEFDCRGVAILGQLVAAIELVRKPFPGGGETTERHLVLLSSAAGSPTQEIGRLDLGQEGGGPLVPVGQVLYVTKDSRLLAIDVANPTTPVEGASCRVMHDPFPDTLSESAHRVAVDGDRLYRAVNARGEHGSGIEVVDISEAMLPKQDTSWLTDTPGNVTRIDASGRHVVLGERDNGFRIMDVSDPILPIQVSAAREAISGTVMLADLAASGDQLYVLSTDQTLYRIDVSDPVAPRLMNSTHIARAWSLAADGRYVVVGTEQSFPRAPILLVVLELQSDGQLRKVGEIAVGDDCSGVVDIALDAGQAYLACDAKVVKIVTLTPPHRPRLLSSVALPGYSYGIIAQRGYAYVVTKFPTDPEDELLGLINNGVVVLDVGDGERPRVVSQWSTTTDKSRCYACSGAGTAWSISAWGPHLFLPTRANSVRVIDIEDPVMPRQADEVAISGFAFAAVAHGGYLYVAGRFGGLYIFRILSVAATSTPVFSPTVTDTATKPPGTASPGRPPSPTVTDAATKPSGTASPGRPPSPTTVATPGNTSLPTITAPTASPSPSPADRQTPTPAVWQLFMPHLVASRQSHLGT